SAAHVPAAPNRLHKGPLVVQARQLPQARADETVRAVEVGRSATLAEVERVVVGRPECASPRAVVDRTGEGVVGLNGETLAEALVHRHLQGVEAGIADPLAD